MTIHITRRHMLAASASMLAVSPAFRAFAADKHVYRIGACDWSIGKRQDIAAVALAEQLGLDGVQVSFDDEGARYDLRKPEVRAEYAAACAAHHVAISSLAMGVLNRIPYATSDDAERWVGECIDVMAAMGQTVVLLAFFGAGDINGKRDLQDRVIDRLKRIAPKAEKASVVLGIESWMNAEDHLRVLDAVNSPAVKVYYDVANMQKMGYDLYAQIAQLGAARICQFHCKENTSLLGQGKVDFPRLRDVIEKIDYRGWLIIESAIPPGSNVADAYPQNQKYLRTLFNG